jgi:hypothetical protein
MTVFRSPAMLVSAHVSLLLLATAAAKPLPATAPLAFADIADLTLAAPAIVRATIGSTQAIAAKDAPGLAPGRARLLVTARIDAALVAPGAVPAMLTFLWDAPLDARGKAPRPREVPILAWITAPAADGKARLVARGGLQPWQAATEAAIRAVVAADRGGTVPIFTGVANGFRAEGTIPGESESQFFLTTRNGGTVAMVVTARPGERRRVAIARGDVIDDAAAPVAPDTLLHYRLACFLPPRLPPAVAEGAADAAELAADWQAALATIGPCGRTLATG